MSKEKYGFSKEVEKKAYQKAESFSPTEKKNIHHICPCSLAKKFNLPHNKIVSPDNAIALEQDFHDAIHNGGKFFDEEINEWGDIDAFDEDDYIFLAIALLGLAESDFDARNIRQTRIHRSRKKKIRRSRRRR